MRVEEARQCLVKNSYVYSAGMRLRKYLEKRCKELGLNFDEALFQEEPKIKRPRLDSDDDEENGALESDDEREAQKRR